MVANKNYRLKEIEHQVLSLLWQRGEASVGEIVIYLAKHSPVSYTSVKVICREMLAKGYVGSREKERLLTYYAKINQPQNRLTNTLSRIS